MTSRILAVQRGDAWTIGSPKSIQTAKSGSRYHAAVCGFISNVPDLEKRYGAPSPAGLTPADRLVQLLHQGPDEVVERLKGNFAVLVTEQGTPRLWARRDCLGAHSLYLAQGAGGEGWIVGNSAADVFRASGHRFEEDPEYLAGFFSLHAQPLEGRTPFRSVRSLLPGELLTIDGARVRRTRTPFPVATRPRWSSENEAVEQFRDLLDDSVRNCLATATDTAVMLSGGMDSAPVAVLADRTLRSTDRRLLPITWSLHEFPEADETRWVDEVAERLSTPLLRLESSQLLPFTDPAAAPVNPESPFFNPFRPLLNRCYRTAAEQGCSVILNGSDGDRIYPFYPLLYQGYLAHGEWGHLFEDLRGSLRRGGWRAIWNKTPLHELLKQPLRRFVHRRPPRWLTAAAKAHWRDLPIWPPECLDHPVPRYAEQVCGRYITTDLCEEYFQACDSGVERREPFHNEELVAFMLAAPFSFSIRNHRTKWIMREAMKGLLPESVRRKGRTGRLGSFYRAGKSAHRGAIESLLFKQRREWQRWVDADAVAETVADDRHNGPAATMTERCIGYVNWLNYWQGGSG